MSSIKIGKFFELIDHIKIEIRRESNPESRDTVIHSISSSEKDLDGQNKIEVFDDIDITSHEIRGYFQKHKINPKIVYASYYSDDPPTCAMTYQWSTNFRQIKLFLNAECLNQDPLFLAHWYARHQNGLSNSDMQFAGLFIMFVCWAQLFGWVFFDLISDEDLANTTIWGDILFNDQNAIDIKTELLLAEEVYKKADLHIVLGTSQIFCRAWCLHELVNRVEANKSSVFLTAITSEGREIKQVQTGLSELIGWFAFGDADKFDAMEAFNPDDKKEIQRRIEETIGPARFNNLISRLIYLPLMLVYFLMLCAVLTLLMVSFPLHSYFNVSPPTAVLVPISIAYTISILMYLVGVYFWLHCRLLRAAAVSVPPLINTALIAWMNVSGTFWTSLGVMVFFLITSTSSTLYFLRPALFSGCRGLCSPRRPLSLLPPPPQ
jgi:hypothetical protein